MTDTSREEDLSSDILGIFGIGGDEGPAAASGEGGLPTFEGEQQGAAVPPAQAAAGEGVTAPPAPAAPASEEPPAAPPAAAPTAEPAPQPQAPAPAAPLPGLAPQPTPTPAAPPAVDPNMELVSLRAQVQMLQQQLAQGQGQGGQQPPAAPAPTTGADGQEETPRYDLTIPDQVAQAIFSEDPAVAKAGMVHLVNSLATIVHTRVRDETRQALQQLETRGETRRQQEAQAAEAEAMKEAYFTAFPTHRDPVVQQIVIAENYKLAQSVPGHPFDQAYIAALGARVQAALAGVAGTLGAPPAAPQAPQAPAAPVPPKPAAMLPNGRSSGGGIPSFEAMQDEIADVFSFSG